MAIVNVNIVFRHLFKFLNYFPPRSSRQIIFLSLTMAMHNNICSIANIVFQQIYYLVYINNIICRIINLLVGQIFARQ